MDLRSFVNIVILIVNWLLSVHLSCFLLKQFGDTLHIYVYNVHAFILFAGQAYGASMLNRFFTLFLMLRNYCEFYHRMIFLFAN